MLQCFPGDVLPACTAQLIATQHSADRTRAVIMDCLSTVQHCRNLKAFGRARLSGRGRQAAGESVAGMPPAASAARRTWNATVMQARSHAAVPSDPLALAPRCGAIAAPTCLCLTAFRMQCAHTRHCLQQHALTHAPPLAACAPSAHPATHVHTAAMIP